MMITLMTIILHDTTDNTTVLLLLQVEIQQITAAASLQPLCVDGFGYCVYAVHKLVLSFRPMLF